MLKNPERSLSAIEKFSRDAKRYLVIKTLISAVEGIVMWGWLLILGVNYPVLWGTLVFLMNYVPNIGSIVAALPAILLAFIQLGVGSAFLTALGFLVANMALGNIIDDGQMHEFVVFLSMVFWGWVLGPIGMIISVPMTSLVKIALESCEGTRGLAVMLGSGAEIEQVKGLMRWRR